MPPPCPSSPASLRTEQIRACVSLYDQSAWTAKLEVMHILQAQVFSCVSIHPGLPHQKPKRETSDASKSQLNQSSWNGTVIKCGSENQLYVHNYLSIPFYEFPLIARSGKTSRHYQFDWACAAQLKFRFVVLKDVRISGIRLRKN